MQSDTNSSEEAWKFSQCFGDKSDTIDVAEGKCMVRRTANARVADVISTVKFDRTGDYLASGDRAGRVVLFQRNNTKRSCEYRFYTEFQSHEPEFDYLKSLEINEKINKIVWCRRTNDSHFLLTTNDKTVKLWKVKERQVQAVVENNMSTAQKLVSTDVRLPLMLPKLVDRESVIAATPKRIYSNAHAYHIHSISLNSDEETFLSADDLRVNLWNVNNVEQSFNVVDMKPASIEELTEVITTAHFHPQHCNLFAFGTSKGYVKLCDMRAAALCDRHAKVFKRDEEGAHSFFSELISSVSDISFSQDGRHFVTRDYMTMKVWDLAMESHPVLTIPVHDAIKPKLCDLYENDSIFDRFECAFNYDGTSVLSGSYSNMLRVTTVKDNTSDVIQADKSIFRSKKASRVKMPRAQSVARLDDSLGELDFERKILNAAAHPRENTVAIAALSNLFVFSQVAPL
jgi:serine/threonine-protein phosphatase 2A regulatory subunit B